jgi:competence protein ComEA
MKPPELKTWQAILLGFISGAVMLAAVIYISLPDRMVPLKILPTATPAPVIVHVSGAVNKPGLYTLAPDKRLQDAINAAGGSTESADLDKVNLAAPLADGMKISIPVFGEKATQQNVNGSVNPTEPVVIHLNTATTKDLELLPGIGVEKAAAIVTERENRGRFQSIDDLLSVAGISKNLYEQVKPFIMLD